MKIASVGYATEQGLGYLMKSFYEAGIITHPIIWQHHKHPNHTEWYPPGTPVVSARAALNADVERIITDVDALLCFETFFDWELVRLCRSRNTRSVLMPMHEWSPRRWPARPDALLCPSRLDLDYFKSEFGDRAVYLPVPVDPSRWRLRTVARRYLHNAGHVGHREHKGTRQLLEALKYLKSDLSLTVRCQYHGVVQAMAREAGVADDLRLKIVSGYLPYDSLWDDYDVYVAPEKQNGLSLPLQEAYAAGLLVLTTDRYPANTWLPREPLIPVERYERACVSPNYLEFDSAVVNPRNVAATMDLWYGRDIIAYSRWARSWANAHSWEFLKPHYLSVLEGFLR